MRAIRAQLRAVPKLQSTPSESHPAISVCRRPPFGQFDRPLTTGTEAFNLANFKGRNRDVPLLRTEPRSSHHSVEFD